MKIIIAFFIFLQISNVCLAQVKKIPVQVNYPNNQFELVGKLGVKLGNTVTVQGIIIGHGPSKGDEGVLNLVVQLINDSATQHFIKIPVSPYWGEFGKKPLPKLKNGDTYIFRAYETGEFDGIPNLAYAEADIMLQAKGFYFRNRLVIISGKKIEPIESTPDKFLEQNALFSGIAKNQMDTAIIEGSKWKLKLIGFRKWMDSELGKVAEVYGKIQQAETKDIYIVENGEPRLVKLEDQLGKTVKLRGRAISMNGYWWFNYRGIDMYVEKMEELANWTGNNHFRPIEITGTLEQAKLARIDQLLEKPNPDLKMYYIVRKPNWTPIDELLTPELPYNQAN